MKQKTTLFSDLLILKQLLLALLLCSSIFSYSQKPYYNQQENFLKANSVWVGGYQSGVNFNSGSPVAIPTKISRSEGCASVADPVTGQLLFYSDGDNCWNRNDQVMPNGNGLLGNAATGSTTQGVCIVPIIDSIGKYYLFSLNYEGNTPSLYYSVVDMSLNAGLGDIVPGRKNIVLDNSSLSEAMIAIPGNNCDIWLLVHKAQEPVFKAYHITADGLDTVPVISTTGQSIQGMNAYKIGCMSVSPDRTKVAIASSDGLFSTIPNGVGVLVAKFNAATGQVSEAISLSWSSTYGVAFSPDNSKLYTAGCATADPGISQYDISVFDSAAMVSSRRVIVDTLKDYFFGFYLPRTNAYLRLYNNKIYFILGLSGGLSLACINDPNLSGSAVRYDSMVIQFPGTIDWGYGMHAISNEVVYPLPPDTLYQLVLDTAFCKGNEILIAGSSDYANYLWNDGSTGQNRTVTTAGTYWVLNEDTCHSRVDTFIVEVYDFIPPVISVDSFTLRTSASYTTYQWLLNGNIIPGATDSTYIVMENGNYQVIVSNEYGCKDTSGVYEITNVGIDNIRQLAGRIRVYPNPANSIVYINAPIAVNFYLCSIQGKVLKQVEQSDRVSLQDLAEGIYFLQIYDRENRLLKIEKIVKTF